MRNIPYLFVFACVLCLVVHNVDAQPTKGKAKKRSSATTAKTEAPKTEAKPAAAAPADAKATGGAASKPADDNKSDEKKSDEAKGDAPAADGAGGLNLGNFGGGGDFPFDLMQASSMQIDPDGMTVLTSKVVIKSKDFNIACDQLKMNNKTKMVYATGNPVRLDQGTAVQALCRNLEYNMDNRSATLKVDASIIQDKGGQKMKATADTIIIDNSDNKDGKGQPKVTLTMNEGSNSTPKIEVIGKKGNGDAGKKTAKTQKVSSNNVDLIKVPSISKAPGVD